MRNWCRSITGWNLALDEQGRPNIGPFPCGGVVTIHSQTKEIVRSGQFWGFAHYSRSLRRGAHRFDTKSEAGELSHVAFENPDGEVVEHLRRDLHPELPHLAAHHTRLPPRSLQGSEFSALQTLEELCGHTDPFEITLGEVETFVPVTPTVFIRVAHAAYRMRELHDRLNTRTLEAHEEWPYMPHLTIAKLSTEAQAQEAYRTACDRWAQFSGSRRIHVKELTFVRAQEPNQWVDLAGVPLGRSLVSRTAR